MYIEATIYLLQTYMYLFNKELIYNMNNGHKHRISSEIGLAKDTVAD